MTEKFLCELCVFVRDDIDIALLQSGVENRFFGNMFIL